MFIHQRVVSYLQLSKWSKGISITAFVTAFCCLCATEVCQKTLYRTPIPSRRQWHQYPEKEIHQFVHQLNTSLLLQKRYCPNSLSNYMLHFANINNQFLYKLCWEVTLVLWTLCDIHQAVMEEWQNFEFPTVTYHSHYAYRNMCILTIYFILSLMYVKLNLFYMFWLKCTIITSFNMWVWK